MSKIINRTLQRLEARAIQENCSPDELLNRLLDSVYPDSAYERSNHSTLNGTSELMHQISDAVIVTDSALKITAWNKGAEKIYGWTESEALGQELDVFLQTQWIDTKPEQARDQLLETGHWQGEILQKTRDQKECYIEASVSLKRDSEGNFTGGITVNRDITAHKRIEQELRNSEASLRLLFENNPYPMWVYDLETLKFIEVNLAAIKTYGYSREEFLTLDLTKIRPPEDIPRLLEDLRINRPILQHSDEWRHQLKNGDIITVEILSHRLYYDEREAVLVVALNVTESKKAREALRLSEAKYRTLVESSDSAISVVDAEGRYLYMNEIAARPFGMSADALTGKHVADLFPLEATTILSDVHKVIAQAEGMSLETTVIIGGELEWFRTSIQPLYDAFDRPYAVMINSINITDIKNADRIQQEQKQLRIILEKEKELNAVIQKAVSALSHDLRTPLSIISLSKETLSQYSDRLGEDQRKAKFSQIDTQLHYVIKLLDDLTMVARGNMNESLFHPTRVNVEMLCQICINDIQSTSGKDHQLSFVTDEQIKTAFVDETLISRMLLNLLTNATKFSPMGSEIRLELGQDGNKLVLRVVDHGMGIAPEHHQKIYDAFYRTDNVQGIAGTGLGLNIVKECVDRHGGKIDVESELGKGTTFTIQLPIMDAAG